MGAALERYRLATSAPRTAGGGGSKAAGGGSKGSTSTTASRSPAPTARRRWSWSTGWPTGSAGWSWVGPAIDPAARTATRQTLRWLRDTAREDPLQLPILLRDVRDAGPHRVAGP